MVEASREHPPELKKLLEALDVYAQLLAPVEARLARCPDYPGIGELMDSTDCEGCPPPRGE